MKSFPDYTNACARCPYSGSIIEGIEDCPDAYKEIARGCGMNIKLLAGIREKYCDDLLDEIRSELNDTIDGVFFAAAVKTDGLEQPVLEELKENLSNALADVIKAQLNKG